ncbi:MAG: serpin family protein [Chlamydia sp.]
MSVLIALEESSYQDHFASSIEYPREDISLISPYSLYDMGSLLWLGSSGKTKKELELLIKAFKGEEKKIDLNASLEELKSRSISYKPYLESSVALFIDSKISILPQFLEGLDRYWKCSTAMNLSFRENPEESIDQINSYIELMTKNRLKKVISSDDIDSETVAVMVSTLSFDADWKHKFDPGSTKKSTFFSGDSPESVQSCDMMQQSQSFAYYTHSGWSYVALPFQKKSVDEKDNSIEFICEAILPPKKLTGLSKESIQKKYIKFCHFARQRAREQYITLLMPKCTIRKRIDLKPLCERIGISSPFDQKEADFRKISQSPLVIQKFFQEVQLSIEEEGAQVEAATVVGMRMRSMLPIHTEIAVEFNHPFFIVIREKSGGIPILFAHISSI